MRSIGALIGFDARMPGVLSFVAPVFSTPEFARAGQVSEREGGPVRLFRAVSAGPGFMATSSSLCVVSGEPRLYAFQTTEREIVAGDARRLSQFLVNGAEEGSDFLEDFPRTKGAIDRFVEMARALGPARKASSLYVMQRPRVGVSFTLAEVRKTEASKPVVTFESAVGSLRRLVWRGLTDGHMASFGGHAAFAAGIRAHVSTGGIVAQHAASAVARALVTHDRHWAHGVRDESGAPCQWCAFQLVSEYPSERGVRTLIRIVASIVRTWEESLSPPTGNTLYAAVSALIRYLRAVPALEGGDPTRDEVLFLFNRIVSAQLLKQDVAKTIHEMSLEPRSDQWIERGAEERYIGDIQDVNARFDAFASTAEAAAAED